MSNIFNLNSANIVGMQIEENFGKYGISCKVGAYYSFDISLMSNQLHTHNSYELCIVISGAGTFLHAGKKFNLNKGDVFIANPFVLHEVQINSHQDLQLIYFFINISTNELLTPKNPEDHMIHAFLQNHHEVSGPHMHLLAYFSFIEIYNDSKKSRGFGSYQAVKNLIIESLDCLSIKRVQFNNPIAFSFNALELSLDYIDNNLNKKITLPELSKHSNTSVRNLQYLFQRHLNKTVIEYINQRKINLASHLLTLQFSIQDTANQIGIGDVSQFTKLFKKYKSITPKKYQMQYPKEYGFGRRL